MDFDSLIYDYMEEDMYEDPMSFPYESGSQPENLQFFPSFQSCNGYPFSTSLSSSSGQMAASSTGTTYGANTIQQDDFVASADYAVGRVVSPRLDQDVSEMQRPFSYSEDELPASFLIQPAAQQQQQEYMSETAFARHQSPSPWNALRAEQFHASAVETQTQTQTPYPYQRTTTEYHPQFLDVPWYTQQQSMGNALMSSPATPVSFTGRPPDEFAGALGQEGIGDGRQATRPRGGRMPGMNLTEDSVDNVRRVRRAGGACVRCSVLKMKCSYETPCQNCRRPSGRKWDGCVRSFKELLEVFNPELMATRLQSQPITEFMAQHIRSRPNSVYFDLPLNFGFGNTFHGFIGAEYDPTTVAVQYSPVVGPTDRHPESPLWAYSLPVYPVNSGSSEVQGMVWDWLKETLESDHSMEEWLHVCFRGENVEWIRELLRVARQYSLEAWRELRSNNHQTAEPHLYESLLHAWMMALLATMLSLSITIPPDARHDVLSQLQQPQPPPVVQHSSSSRPINKCAKSLLFHIYKRLVKKVMAALEAFRKTRLKNISARHLGHVHCIAILIVVVTSQLQTSLMDNYRLSSSEDLWQETVYHIRQVEKAFKNTVLYVRHINKDWLKLDRREDEHLDPRLLSLLNEIQNIKSACNEEISVHRTVKLESMMDPDLPFDSPNMQRAFAFYFDLDPDPVESRARVSR